MRVLTYLNGNLAAEVMAEVIHVLSLNPFFDIRVSTDGFLPTRPSIPSTNRLQVIRHLGDLPTDVDLFLTSIMSPGTRELELVDYYKKRNIPTLMILGDVASGIQKFSKCNVVPTWLAVGDKLTWKLFLDSGFPPNQLLAIGNPFFDRFRHASKNERRAQSKLQIGVLSVPNRVDFRTWGGGIPYTEIQVALEISKVAKAHGLKTNIRLHPKEYSESPYSSLAMDPRIIISGSELAFEDFADSCTHIISTYSMGLVQAYCLGSSCISYQPTDADFFRHSLYRSLGIPQIRSPDELARQLRSPNDNRRRLARLEQLFFNFGNSTEVLCMQLAEMVQTYTRRHFSQL